MQGVAQWGDSHSGRATPRDSVVADLLGSLNPCACHLHLLHDVRQRPHWRDKDVRNLVAHRGWLGGFGCGWRASGPRSRSDCRADWHFAACDRSDSGRFRHLDAGVGHIRAGRTDWITGHRLRKHRRLEHREHSSHRGCFSCHQSPHRGSICPAPGCLGDVACGRRLRCAGAACPDGAARGDRIGRGAGWVSVVRHTAGADDCRRRRRSTTKVSPSPKSIQGLRRPMPVAPLLSRYSSPSSDWCLLYLVVPCWSAEPCPWRAPSACRRLSSA
ncbi:hypothetical protein SAMN05444006_1337 [Allgaiera indica]|uniref:Uncharacterized protein n=1 Tax=Allgaiera indica TaxID=765699 RepID=A0A1H3F0X4_9RHOB|nr:hypothetical protein SAMN05444006_1337 [Allgaiera indica]